MYISKFSKQDREYLIMLNDRTLETYSNKYSSIEEKIEKSNYRGVLIRAEKINKGDTDKSRVKESGMIFLRSTADDVMGKGILERFINNDVEKQIQGIYTSGRLRYILSISKDFEYDSCDCLHVYTILNALSINDFELINKFLIAIPGPSKYGHTFSRTLCNVIYDVLSKDQNKLENALNSIYNCKEKSVYDKALLQAIRAIIEGDFDKLEEMIFVLLKNHKKKYSFDGEIKYICLQAHAIVNLAKYFNVNKVTRFDMDMDHILWDKDFHELVNRDRSVLKEFYDFSKVNSKLQKWIIELPLKIEIENLLE